MTLAASLLAACQAPLSLPEAYEREHGYSETFVKCCEQPLINYTAMELEAICAQEEVNRLKKEIFLDWQKAESQINQARQESQRKKLSEQQVTWHLNNFNKMKALYQEMLTAMENYSKQYAELMGVRASRYHYYGAQLDFLHLYRRHFKLWWEPLCLRRNSDSTKKAK